MTVFAGRISQKYDVQGTLIVDQAKTLADENLSKGAQTATGTGDSFALAGSIITLTDAGASFTTADIGRFITVAGSTTPGNDGTFLIEEYVDGNNIKYTNASGATEAYSGAWEINDPYSLEDDLNFERTDRKLIKGTPNYYDDVPTYERPSAVGTDIPNNLTNIMSVDKFAEVRTVKQAGISLRPSVTGAGSVGLGSAILSETGGYSFIAEDLDSFVTIVEGTATGCAGTYRVKAVTAGNNIQLEGMSPSGAGTVTWTLEPDLKGILSSRNYADAVDRRGIPIADSGEEDETVYEATFADCIDPVTGGRPVEEDGDQIWARTFGDEKEPNAGSTNEATRFFVQLLTGANDGSATDSLLEPISGRSGAAATIAGGDKVIGGLTGMTDQDEGRWITVYGCGNDQAGHYKIVTVTDANNIVVERSAGNFSADANTGSIDWLISRHPMTWDFYNGDRYRKDEMSETAYRTTLVGGVIADAEISQDILEVREYIGAADGDTSPELTNTGNHFVWSDLPNLADTSLEECINEINEQIGDRDYDTPGDSIITDGETITESLQALADALMASNITRIIERLAAAVPKQTAHTLPGGNTYTLDGTNNGVNMFVFWRKALRDPGSVANDDDYDETSTTSITPFEKIEARDHINYMILQ